MYIDVEKFTGLNVHSFNHIEVFVEISSTSAYYVLIFSIIKQWCLYSQKSFHGIFKTVETSKVQPSESFPLQYLLLTCS